MGCEFQEIRRSCVAEIFRLGRKFGFSHALSEHRGKSPANQIQTPVRARSNLQEEIAPAAGFRPGGVPCNLFWTDLEPNFCFRTEGPRRGFYVNPELPAAVQVAFHIALTLTGGIF